MSRSRAFKSRLFAELALLGRALGNAHRLELLDLLAQGERNVDDLAREAQISVASASSHLQALRRARLVEADRRGLFVWYSLAGPDVFDLYRRLRDVGSGRLAEVDRLVEMYVTNRGALDLIDLPTLRRLLDEGAVTVLDVRPPTEYRQGHVAGAHSIPLAELARRLAELPAGREVVAYCRGPYCLLSDEALTLLRAHGFQARRLADGFPEWQAAGHPVGSASE